MSQKEILQAANGQTSSQSYENENNPQSNPKSKVKRKLRPKVKGQERFLAVKDFDRGGRYKYTMYGRFTPLTTAPYYLKRSN